MTIGLDQAPAEVAAAEGQLTELTAALAPDPTPDLAPEQARELTPEKARELAAALAEHMVAMRAVTAGTQYAAQTGPGLRPISPATEIFLAGMLERIRADEAAAAMVAADSVVLAG
jgi:hypothetical protein